MDIVVEEFVVLRRDVPRFDFAAQVLVEHGRENEVVSVVDEGDVRGSANLQSGKNPSEAASENHDSRF